MSFDSHSQASEQVNPPRLRLANRSCLMGIVAALLVLACGCGPADEERPDLYPAQGSLWINDQPAEGAMLVFHRVGHALFDARGTRPTATVDAEGKFALTTYQEGDGAPAGEYQVAILWFDDPDSSSPWDKLGNRFADPTRSEIRVTVSPEQDTLEPIRLDGIRLLPRRPSGNSRDLDQVE